MYLALYRKYRSKTFDEVISQEHITTTLKNQIKSGKLAHAYLFTGSRGTGKTTCAKLMAKAVNCLSPIDGNPCGECEACKAIAAGCSDIVEMDAASNNGVDDVRQLRDEVMYSPVTCKYRVYIIDEVHMMSGPAFNALLKTIEEPPPHVIFILATTEIHKVPATILSRCQQFSFRRIDVEDSTKRLCEIARAENVRLDVSAAELISRLSDGGMRDAVSLLDQCISVSDNVTEAVVRATAGVAGFEHLVEIADNIFRNNTAGALKNLDDLYAASKDPILLLDELMGHFRNLMMLRALNNDISYISVGAEEGKVLCEQASRFTTGEILRCIDILQENVQKAGRSTHRKTLAEMCFIKLCTPRLDSDTKALSLRLEKLEMRLDELQKNGINLNSEISIQPTAQSVAESLNEIETEAVDIKAAITDNVEKTSENSKEIIPEEKAKPTQVQSAPPSWLFEGDDAPPPDINNFTGFDEYNPVAEAGFDEYNPDIPPFDAGSSTEPAEQINKTEEPPFDLEGAVDVNEAKTSEQSEEVREIYPEPEVTKSSGNDITASGKWAEILAELPEFLRVLIENTSARIEDNQLIMTDYTPFVKEFLMKGDSVSRIEAAAKTVTGKPCRLIFDDVKSETKKTEKRDRLSEFLENAEKAGVNIKYKN